MVQHPPALETRVQFTVRSVLIGTALVAVGAALLAPWFHRWTAEQRTAFMWTWCNLGGGAGVMVAVACWQRLRAERRAGVARYRLPRWTIWPAVLMVLFWTISVIGYSLLIVSMASYVAARGLLIDPTALQCGGLFALAALGIWWRTDCVELCDAGLLRGSLLIPWETFRGFRWGTFDPNILVLQGRFGITTWRVKPEGKPAIEDFLAKHVH